MGLLCLRKYKWSSLASSIQLLFFYLITVFGWPAKFGRYPAIFIYTVIKELKDLERSINQLFLIYFLLRQIRNEPNYSPTSAGIPPLKI